MLAVSFTALLASSVALASPIANRQLTTKRATPEAGYGLTLCTDTYGFGVCEETWTVDEGCQVIPKESALYKSASSAYTPEIPDVYPDGRYFKCNLAVDDGCQSVIHTFMPEQGVINLLDFKIGDDGTTLQDTLYSYNCMSIPGPDPRD